jgi:hypothetical protein
VSVAGAGVDPVTSSGSIGEGAVADDRCRTVFRLVMRVWPGDESEAATGLQENASA